MPADEISLDVLGKGVTEKRLSIATSAYQAAAGAHALAIVTEWDEFKTLDYEKLYASMSKPACIFDGRNILDHKKLTAIGFRVHAIGK